MEEKNIGSRILSGTVTIVLVGIFAKIAAFLSEAILAAYLGTTYQSDAYYMVSSIKDVIYPMLSVGIWKVFFPIYKEKVAQGELASAEELSNQTLTLFTIASSVVVILMMLFSPLVVSLVAPGFEGETREICVKLVRLSAPMYVLIIASAVYASMLQCHNKFLGSQIREVASHIPTILAAVILYKAYGITTMGLALVAGGAIRLLVELPFVDWGYRFKANFYFRSKEFLLLLRRLPSALVSEGVTQINTLIDKAMASTLPEGTISGLNYGHKLVNVLSGLLSSAIATALFPQMIELSALDKKQELSRLVAKILKIFFLLMIPITLACVLFRTEIVSVVFQRGSFGESSVAITSGVFALYSVGITFIACNTVVNNVFYGFGDTKTPMHISMANLGINVALNFLLIRFWGVFGLATATSLSAILTLFVRLLCVRRFILLPWADLLRTCGKVLLAASVACLIPRVFFWLVPGNKYLVLFASGSFGFAAYFVMVKLLRLPELDDLIKILLKKRRKNPVDRS